jgi:hypothetical protein
MGTSRVVLGQGVACLEQRHHMGDYDVRPFIMSQFDVLCGRVMSLCLLGTLCIKSILAVVQGVACYDMFILLA